MPTYTCEFCKKVFSHKIDFTKHQNKKASCISIDNMQKLSPTKEVKMDTKTTLISIFRNIMDLLRDNEALVGPKALSTWTPLLILRMIEHHFGGEINIDDYDYDFSHIEDEMVEKHKNKLLESVRFSNLSNENEDNIPVIMPYLWDDILSKHPITKNIFLKGKNILIKHKSTYKKVIDKINSINLNVDNDVLGDAYEAIFKDIMVGKTFGQFFTQPLVKKMMVKLINPQIHPDGKIDTCGDPTMGTGGFLITYLKHILQQATAKNIKPDWDFIKTEGLYGKELDDDTYQLAVSNMLISSGHMFEGLDRGDSIREPITRKFDNILANPPFGIKGLKYDDFQSSLKFEYVPIKTDNAVSLFIQAIIYMLKINGKCAVVLPDGQDLFSKTNKTLIAVREYLMKTCDLKEIRYLPPGIFTYTSIKTCVFYFVKKREGTDVLETKIKVSKTQKETGRDYKFSKTHQTTKVKFYDYNPYEDLKNLLVEVPIEKIVSNSYSLNYAEYMKDETEEEKYEEGIVVKTLGEVCKFLPKSKRNAKYGNKEGLYPFFKSSIKVDCYVDDPDYEEESLIIGDGGEPNINYGIKFSTSDHCYILQNKNKLLLNLKYAYYYLYHNLDMLKQLYTGVAIKNISKTNIEGIKIPIPSLERQQEIVKYLDFIYEKANKSSNEKISELKQLNEFCLNNQKIFGENVVKTLGELCSIDYGKRIVKGQVETGEYPVLGGGGFTSFYTNKYSREGKTCKISREGMSLHNCVMLLNEKYYLNSQAFTIKSKNKSIINEYLWYYLDNNKEQVFKCGRGTAQKAIDIDEFKSIKIPIPTLERQKKIVEYCEYNDALIKQLEKEIENNKKQAQQFITGIVNAQVEEEVEEQSETSSVNAGTNEVIQDTLLIEEEIVIEPKAKSKIMKEKVKKPVED
jgi:type I restriction-modification system DNA methylase subunit/restriction endonuclease S subunit